MTGELFNLLREHSILADLLSAPARVDEAFQAGVRKGLESDELTAELFSVRARVLLGKAARTSAASYTSGLLIGTDIRTGIRGAPEGEIVVMGRPELTSLFAAALRIAGRTAREVDGEQAFLGGVKHLAELIQ
jgi:2-dehydro-3-deoxygalactonokinase